MAETSRLKRDFEQEIKFRGQQAEKYQNLWETLNQFIRQSGGFLISSPAEKYLRIEVPNESALPDKLFDLGYDLRPAGANTRIVGGRFLPVRVYSFRIPAGR